MKTLYDASDTRPLQYALTASITSLKESMILDTPHCFVRQDQILGKAIFRYFPKPALLNQSPYEEETDQ